jgi:hypothetical protein
MGSDRCRVLQGPVLGAAGRECRHHPRVRGLLLQISGTSAKTRPVIGRGAKMRRVDQFLRAAYEEARQGLAEGGIPIGSVLVHEGRILGHGHNRRVQSGSAIRHAEMDALEQAGRQTARVYRASTLYTRCRRARCAAGPFSSTRFRMSSSARTGHSRGRKRCFVNGA